MRRDTQEAHTGSLPLRIPHHRVKASVPCMPPAMILFSYTFPLDRRRRDQMGQIFPLPPAAANTQEDFVILERANGILNSLQSGREPAQLVKNPSAKGDIGCQ